MGEEEVKVPGKLVGEVNSCWGEAATGCSGVDVDMMMEEKEGSLVRALVSTEDTSSASSTLLLLAFTVCGSRVETEEVLLSSPWLRKSGVGEVAEWNEDESSRGLFEACAGR